MDKLLNGSAAHRFVGCGKTLFWTVLAKKDDFPGAVVLNKRRYWRRSELQEWLDKQRVRKPSAPAKKQ